MPLQLVRPPPPHPLINRTAGRYLGFGEERNGSFRSEGPQGRNRTLFVRTERSGPPDGRPDRVNQNRFPARPKAGRFKAFYSDFACPSKPTATKLHVHHPPAPPPRGRRFLSPCARTGTSAAPYPHSQAPSCTTPGPAFASRISRLERVERGMLAGRSRY